MVFSIATAPMIFENMFRENVVEKTYEYIQNGTRALNVQEMLEEFTGSLPVDFVQEFFPEASRRIFGV